MALTTDGYIKNTGSGGGGGYSPGGTDVALADGGTGASTAAGARTNLAVLSIADNLSDVNNATTARGNLNSARVFIQSTDPDADFDSADNVLVGDFCFNDASNALFLCEDNTATAAVWTEVNPNSAVWGSITGTLSNQTDLNNAIAAKVAKAGDTMTGPLISDSAGSITADSNQNQANATQLTKSFNRITTCATENDAVKAPAAVPGAMVLIQNDGAETAQIFPQSGENFEGSAADAAITLVAGGKVVIGCIVAGTWFISSSAVLDTFAALANSAGVLTNDGVGGLSWAAGGGVTAGEALTQNYLTKANASGQLVNSRVSDNGTQWTYADATGVLARFNRTISTVTELATLDGGLWVRRHSDSGDIAYFAPHLSYITQKTQIGGAGTAARKLEVIDASALQCRDTYTAGSVYTDRGTLSTGAYHLRPSGGELRLQPAAAANALLSLVYLDGSSACALKQQNAPSPVSGSGGYLVGAAWLGIGLTQDSSWNLTNEFIRLARNGATPEPAPNLKAANAAPTDSYMMSGSVSFYLDETANELKVRAKYADGTTYKTGTVCALT